MKLNSEIAKEMVELVWGSLLAVKGYPGRRKTAWGSKTRIGLAACFERIMRGES